jgi:hypothetical protein
VSKKTGSVRFRFLKSKTDWTEPNRTESVQPDQPLKKTTINRILFLTLNLKLKLYSLHSLHIRAAASLLLYASLPSPSLCIPPPLLEKETELVLHSLHRRAAVVPFSMHLSPHPPFLSASLPSSSLCISPLWLEKETEMVQLGWIGYHWEQV